MLHTIYTYIETDLQVIWRIVSLWVMTLSFIIVSLWCLDT